MSKKKEETPVVPDETSVAPEEVTEAYPEQKTKNKWTKSGELLLAQNLLERAEQEPAYASQGEKLTTHQWNFLASIELERSLPTPSDMGLGEGNGAITLEDYMEGLIRVLNAGL